jgi:beta-lactamase regulating signal transducer with metallopeptidase domain
MEALIHAGLVSAFFATVLAVIVAGVAMLFRRRPAVVHALWILVLVKFLVPSFYPIEIPGWRPSATSIDDPEPIGIQENPPLANLEEQIPSPPDETPAGPIDREHSMAAITEPAAVVESSEAILDPTPRKPSAWQFSWEHLVAIAWLAGSLTWMVAAGIRIVRFHRLVRFAQPSDHEVRIRVQELTERLGLSVCPSIAFVSAPIAPLLWALTRSPRLLIPSQLWERLNEEQRDTLLVHELAHLRRGDHWVRRLEMVVLALYWWHPVVWWVQRQLREAEEQCCDAWVLWTLPHAAQDYAVALVETLAFLRHSRPVLPLGASGIEPIRLLKRRLSMIVQGQTPPAMSRIAFGIIVVLGALILPLLPVPAQQPRSDKSDNETVQPSPGEKPILRQALPAPKGGGTNAKNSDDFFEPKVEDRSDKIEAAKEQIELLKAQLMIRRAELEETKTVIRLAQRHLSRVEELYKRGNASESMVESARNDLELREPQLRTKEAEVQKAEILLKQAERRLRRLEAGEKTPETPLSLPTKKAPASLPPAKSGAGRKDAPTGKGLPGAPPGPGMPGKMGPGFPGSGGPVKGLPGLSAGPAPGSAPADNPVLPGTSMVPPLESADGLVLEADAKLGLTKISINTARIKPGDKLDVYRLKPNPKYLGKIEILKVQDKLAVGRKTDGERLGPLEKGDLVTSKMIDKWEGLATAIEPNSSWAAPLFEKKSWDFGPVRRGEQLRHTFWVANRLDKPIHIAGVRSSAAYVTPHLVVVLEESGGAQAKVTETWLRPHQSARIDVSLDTRRFVGYKTASIYVQFDEPSVAEVQLQVHARCDEPPAGTAVKGEPEESKTRILELELKVDELLKQMDSLRKELKEKPAKPAS